MSMGIGSGVLVSQCKHNYRGVEMMRWSMVMFAAIMLAVGISLAEEISKWNGKSVLILGDSLVGEGSGLEMGLRKQLKGQGAYVTTKAEIGGRASSWAKDSDLEMYLAESRVDAVVVVLGLNSCRTPPKTYGRHVRALARRLRGKECYWIGPPLLIEGAAGFMIQLPKTVEANSECKFFDTVENVEFQPGSVSGFHVRRWKGIRWAKKVWAWMNNES